MGSKLNIYGTDVEIKSSTSFVEDWGCPNDKSMQFWQRKELPHYFQMVEYNSDGDAMLDNNQREYALEEVRRCREGFYFLNNGVETYITGKHYFYLQWWKLEDDIYADYRETDRKYFLFLDYWEKVSWCLGVVRGKKRREGASSQATSNLIYEAIFYKNSVCGLVSKSEIDGKKTFTKMVAFGYRQLPVFLKPKQLNNKDSISELVFAHKSVNTKDGKGKTIDSDTGHRSSIDFRSPSTNAYDSGRLSRGLFDEGGKWGKEAPFSTFIAIVKKTMVKGVKRVGFLEAPSTVNEMSKSGGEEFKIVWDGANQHKNDRTPNRLVKYFTPAYEGYLGFIDKYGHSVVDAPNKEQYDYLVENFVGIGDLTEEDIKKGAKGYLLSIREKLTGAALEEEIRMNPFDEEEMFMYAGHNCEFNSINIQKQLNELEQNPVFLRRARLVKNVKIIKSPIPNVKDRIVESISFVDSESGGWYILEPPKTPNNFKKIGDYYEPLSKLDYQIGVDTTKDDFAIDGSKPTICVFKKSCIIDGEETGLYPVALYLDRARLDIHFDEEVLKACMWYGCTANYEIDAGTQFYRYFAKLNANYFLEWTPKFAQDPVKMKPLKPGSQSADPFQLAAQLQVAKMYIDGTSNEGYNGHVHRIKFPTLLKQLLKYDHAKRTPYDQVISLMMCLLCVIGDSQLLKTTMVSKPKNLLPKYNLKLN